MESKIFKIKKSLLSIALDSTAHGLPNIFRKEKKGFRYMWAFLCCVAWALLILLTQKLVANYYKYEVVTNINVYTEIPAM